MQIQFAPEPTSATGTAAQASRTPACTPVAAPLPAPISVASVDATPAAVCVRASPAPAPSALTAADEKPVMESLAELQAKLERILAKLAPMDDHDAAATSSPSTTTTSPPTAPQHAPPSAINTAAATTTNLSPTVLVPAPSQEALTRTESVVDRPLQPSVVPELAMSTPARCSTECRHVLASAALSSTTSLTLVQKAAVLPAVVWSGRVPPRPPDRRCTSPEQGVSLSTSVPLSVSRKETRCSWLRPVPVRPPDQCKFGEIPLSSHSTQQNSNTACAFGPVSLASQPRYERGSRGLLVANHSKLNDMALSGNVGMLIMPAPEANDMNGLEFSIHSSEFSSFLSTHTDITEYAENVQSNANSRGFLDANHYKLQDMVLCWNVGLLIMYASDAKNWQQQIMDAFPVLSYLEGPINHHAGSPSLHALGVLLDKNWHAPWSSSVQILMYCCYLVSVMCLGIHLLSVLKIGGTLYRTWFNYTCCFVSKEATSCGNCSGTLYQWNDLVAQEALPTPPEFSVLEFAILWVFPGACGKQDDSVFHHSLHCAIYQQVVGLALPFDPGGCYLWNCQLEHKHLPARTTFWWIKFEVQHVFSEASCEQDDLGMNQNLHWAIYQQATDWSIPWDPGGNSPSAWGQADFQGEEYVMYQVYAMYWKAQPRSTKRTKLSLKPTGPSPAQTWVCLCKLESDESRVSMIISVYRLYSFPYLLLLSPSLEL